MTERRRGLNGWVGHKLGAAVLLGLLWAAWPACAQPDLQTIDTRYYVLHTDLDPDGIREVVQRITLMAEEYHERTRGFSGAVNRRLPMYVFRRMEDYVLAGGLPGSAGVFTGDRLMAVAGPATTDHTWHVIQHEGFHQFSRACIGGRLPIWAEEGLAEYFGEGIFTGDSFYTGLIPPERLAEVRAAMRDRKFRPLAAMMHLDHQTWNQEVGQAHERAGYNYSQAWSMVQFLAHGEDGRYQDAFGDFLSSVSRQQPWERVWERIFGGSVADFETAWREYWLGLSEDPTADLYAETTVATLTSYYARALSQRQRFDTFEDFAAAAAAGELKAHAEDWLPPDLLRATLRRAPRYGRWSLQSTGRPLLLCERPDGTILEGQFRVANNRVKSVEVQIRAPRQRGR